MTKPKLPTAPGKHTWGGARPGAGRKKKVPVTPPATDPGPIATLAASNDPVGISDITDAARKLSMGALQALSEVAADKRAKPSERRFAALDILTWAYGKPMGIAAPAKPQAEKKAEMGKKEAVEEAAKNPDTTTPMGKILAMRLKKGA